MGKCKDCKFCETGFLNSYYCSLFSEYKYNADYHTTKVTKYFDVRPDDSCDRFVKKLVAATPKNSNFTGNGNDCFLTSACVKFMGKADDCEELTVLRKFRDEYMKSTEEGAALVKEYYAVAPQIVEKIESSVDEKKYYDGIYSVVTNCVQLINAGKNEEALKEYKAMVENLKKELS